MIDVRILTELPRHKNRRVLQVARRQLRNKRYVDMHHKGGESGDAMRTKRLIWASGAALAVSVASTALAFGSVSPAGATEGRPVYTWNGYQTKFDNDPGNGTPSWAWIYNGGSRNAVAIVEFYDGNRDVELRAYGHNTSHTLNYSRDIWRISICDFSGDNPFSDSSSKCSEWFY